MLGRNALSALRNGSGVLGGGLNTGGDRFRRQKNDPAKEAFGRDSRARRLLHWGRGMDFRMIALEGGDLGEDSGPLFV